MRRLKQCLVSAIITSFLIISFNAFAELCSKPTCTSDTLQTLEVFDCIGRKELPPLEFSPPQSYLDPTTRSAFPTHWHQLGYNQRHNPVFDVSDNAPDFLRFGTIWSTPITGLDYIRLAQAKDSVANDEAWGSRTAQYLGNVVGALVAQGIVFDTP